MRSWWILVGVVVGDRPQAGLVGGERRRPVKARRPVPGLYGVMVIPGQLAPVTESDSSAPSGRVVSVTAAEARLALSTSLSTARGANVVATTWSSVKLAALSMPAPAPVEIDDRGVVLRGNRQGRGCGRGADRAVVDGPGDRACRRRRILIGVVVGDRAQAGLVGGQRRRASEGEEAGCRVVRRDRDTRAAGPVAERDSSTPSGRVVSVTAAEARLALFASVTRGRKPAWSPQPDPP